MSRALISKKVLQWALDRSGLTLDAVERKLPRVREWLAGERRPTLRQLEKFSRLTSTPLGFLFLEEPPAEALPVPYYRTNGRGSAERPSPDLLDTVHTMQRRQMWMRDYLIDQGHEPLPYVASAEWRDDPEEVGRKMRGALGVADGWAERLPSWEAALRHLRRVMETNGILVAVNGVVGNNTHRKLDVGEFRGFVLVDEYAPLVFVNGADGKAAQMFTLAHELAHVWYGSSAAFDLRQLQPADEPSERSCNRAAAEFLVPAFEVRQIWPSVRDRAEPFQELARRFKVSAVVAARRALDLHLIRKAEFFAFYQTCMIDARRRAERREGGGSFYQNQELRVGPRFGAAVARAAREGKLLYSEAYRLTGLYGQTFDKFAASLRTGVA